MLGDQRIATWKNRVKMSMKCISNRVDSLKVSIFSFHDVSSFTNIFNNIKIEESNLMIGMVTSLCIIKYKKFIEEKKFPTCYGMV